ncbi:uncharacterized protein PRCAT00006075001 [Priceomyces carsonii]|uniref:uncharacterized protein n=1 Tax=Priceomyces carsonii TaxID=28549 RepID=UPI002ED92FA2|nr:unnamed protein product [Priceomyces carsonii]
MTTQSKFISLSAPHDLDIVSDLKFSPFQNHFLLSSWDNRVLLYDCSDVNQTRAFTQINSDCPVLRLAYPEGKNTAYGGSLDGSIRQIDYENLTLDSENLNSTDEGIDNGINNLCPLPAMPNVLIASNFNGSVQMVDTRQIRSVFKRKMDSKVFQMDTTKNLVVMTLKSNRIEIYDARDMEKPLEVRDTGLSYQINDLRCLPLGDGFGVSTIDGRVSMEYFDPSPEVQYSKRFTFKCHRSHDKITDTDLVYPVNAIQFNKVSKTLFTGGSDGNLCLWDYDRRKRMKIYPTFVDGNTNEVESIVKLSLSYDNRLIAVATSDDDFKNSKTLGGISKVKTPSKVYLRELLPTECIPKP